MQLDQRDFELIRKLVYKQTGLSFEDRKHSFVQVRVARRAAETECISTRDYYHLLAYEDDGTELQNLVESLTTNETYFFREFPQLKCFADEVLPAVTEPRRRSGDRRLSIWSAACSTGDEPYTLSIILRACLDDYDRWDVHLQATDIDRNVLKTARRALYTERAVKDVPLEYLNLYFRKRLGMYHVADEIKDTVTFSHLNLLDRRAMRAHRGFDVIFCRNALIYFDAAARRRVLSSFYDALVPGGFLFLGHSESVGRISAAYELVSLGGFITYRRPLDDASSKHVLSGDELCLTK